MAIDHSAIIHVTLVTTWSRQSYCYCGMQQLEAQITTCTALGNEDGGAWPKAFGSLLISITYVSFVSNYNLFCLRVVSQSSWLKSWSHLRPLYQEMISSLKDLNIKSFPCNHCQRLVADGWSHCSRVSAKKHKRKLMGWRGYWASYKVCGDWGVLRSPWNVKKKYWGASRKHSLRVLLSFGLLFTFPFLCSSCPPSSPHSDEKY